MVKLLLFCLLMLSVDSRDTVGRIEAVIPTVEQETEYVWQTLQDIPFFESNGYQVSLPKGQLIETLKEKSRNRQLTQADYALLLEHMTQQVYQREDYLIGFREVTRQVPMVTVMLREISESDYEWTFKTYGDYRIVLTLYGPGGSYNPEDGSILLYTTVDGRFKQYDNPANTMIHEITHLGIEESIVQRYQVPHATKERIVDRFVYLHFKERLPEYRIQPMGNERLDDYLQTKDDLLRLNEVVQKCLTEEDK